MEWSYAIISSANVNGFIYHMLILVFDIQLNRFARGDDDCTVNMFVCESSGQVLFLFEWNKSHVHGGKYFPKSVVFDKVTLAKERSKTPSSVKSVASASVSCHMVGRWA